MKPIKTKILFKPFKGNEKTESGLYIPESVQKLSNKGEIVEVGDKVTGLKKGDIGWRVKDWGEEIIIDGEKHYLMESNSILALDGN